MLIRQTMVDELVKYQDEFSKSLALVGSAYGADLGIEGSDGSGNKGAAPWVRIFSRHMSPKASSGFYLVFHFSIDGKRLYITLGCPATIDGSNPLPEPEIKKMVAAAHSILKDSGQDISPFLATISLGKSTRLARQFERATVIAREYLIDSLEIDSLTRDINFGLSLLSTIYAGQAQGKHLSPGDIQQSEIEATIKPLRGKTGQGYGLSGEERRTVEQHAMNEAAAFLEKNGYSVEDKSATQSFDLLAKKDGAHLKVEVKGTTSARFDSILMTRNEVRLHQKEKSTTGLIIVYDIDLSRGGSPSATGGKLKHFIPWDIDECELAPTSYQVTLKSDESL